MPAATVADACADHSPISSLTTAATAARIKPARTVMSTPTTSIRVSPLVIATAAVEIATRLTASASPETNDANEMIHNLVRSAGEVMARSASRLVTTGTLAVRSGLGGGQSRGARRS